MLCRCPSLIFPLVRFHSTFRASPLRKTVSCILIKRPFNPASEGVNSCNILQVLIRPFGSHERSIESPKRGPLRVRRDATEVLQKE